MSDDQPIKITSDEVERVVLPQAASSPAAGLAAKAYGGLALSRAGAVNHGAGLWHQAWFYLGVAGLVGALVGWAICEPFYVDGVVPKELQRWGNYLLIEFVVALTCLGYAVAESLAERSLQKGLQRAILVVAVGAVLGVSFEYIANLLFHLLLRIFGLPAQGDLLHWIARAISWTVFGAVGGIVYGIIGLSVKKAYYGVLGGVLGAALGGFLFDPVCVLARAGAPSRAIGLGLFGCFTGVAMGWVESALKDRWLYVTGGPLAGKQFILYKPDTVFGSLQTSDIYLFKDPAILPEHAVLAVRGRQAVFRAKGVATVNGQTVQETTLRSGDRIQIGRYILDYQEKQKAD